jgi:hypothetical protein
MPEETPPRPDDSGEVVPHGPHRPRGPTGRDRYRRDDDRPPDVHGHLGETIVAGGWAARVVGAILGGENGQRVMIFVLSIAALGVIGWMAWLSREDHQNTMGLVIRSSEDAHDKQRRACDESESKLRSFFSEEASKIRTSTREQTAEVYRFYATEREKDRAELRNRDELWRQFITSAMSKKGANEEFPCPLPQFAEPVTAPSPRLKAVPGGG